MNEQLDPLRAYNDEELRTILGGISRTTLWHLRDDPAGPHSLQSGYTYPGSRSRRTTATQIRNYLTLVEAHADELRREREADDLRLDMQLVRTGVR